MFSPQDYFTPANTSNFGKISIVPFMSFVIVSAFMFSASRHLMILVSAMLSVLRSAAGIYAMDDNPIHRFMNFGTLKCSVPNIIFDCDKSTCSICSFLCFKLKTNAIYRLVDSDDTRTIVVEVY